MSDKKWGVDLSEDERGQLLVLLRKGKVAAQRLRRAHILLHADEGRTDEAALRRCIPIAPRWSAPGAASSRRDSRWP